MGRRNVVLALAVIAVVLLWSPLLYPGGKAALLLLDIYGPTLIGGDVAGKITPAPLESDTTETFAGVAMRVSWWRPALGDSHPAVMIVNGATPAGNDNAASRGFAMSLARAGYLVMLPEFPFLKEGRLDVSAPHVVDSAFASLRDRRETAGHPAGVFAASVGAGIALAAAGTEPHLARADHVTVLGGYFDLRTYIASVATHSQVIPPTGALRWDPSAEASERIPPAIEAAMTDEDDRARVRAAFAATTYNAALSELAALSPQGREVFDRLSPSTAWGAITAPIFWIHDPDDTYEPVAEAEAARAAPRKGRFELVVPRLVQHAEVSPGAASRGPLFLVGELWALLVFTLDVLRIAG